jgi:hypothetical protein
MQRALASLLLLPLLTCAAPAPDGRRAVALELLLDGKPVAGFVRIEDEAGNAVPPEELLNRGLGLDDAHAARRWWVLPGPAAIRLPRRALRVLAVHGLETAIARAELAADASSLSVPLRRFQDPRAAGWRSANTHLHLQKVSRAVADRYLLEVPRADGLDALFVSYLERAEADREYVSNGYADADLRAFTERSGVVFGNGEEHRHNFTPFGEGYGHVMFLDLPKLVRPVSLGPGITKQGTDGVPLRRGIDRARADGATLLWCHNTFGLEDVPSWAAGKPHAQNIFDGDPEAHGSYQDTFYRYLNAGLRVPFSTGTDWFIYDFSRVYAPVAALRTPREWLRELESGRTFITNGPLLEFEVEGAGIGGTVKLERPGVVRFRAKAAGRVDFRALEVVRNGEVVASERSAPRDGHFAASFTGAVDLPGPGWLALRAPPPPVKEKPDPAFPRSELGGALFAHTSPVYVEVAGRSQRDLEAVRGLLEEVRKAKGIVEKSAVFADAHERGHVLEIYDAAAATLEKLLR